MQRKRAVVLNDTSWEHHHGCAKVMANLRDGLASSGIDIASSFPVGKDWRKDKRICADISSCDILVVNGEGTIHDDTAMAQSLVASGEFATKWGVPAILINSTWHSNSLELAEKARFFKNIYVRESRSQAELAKNGVKSAVVPDLTFMSCKESLSDELREGVIVTDSVYNDISEKLYCTSKNHNDIDFIPLLAPFKIRETSGKFIEKYIKYKIYGLVSEQLEALGLVRQHYISMRYVLPSVEDILNAFLSHKLVVCARFHGLCFALQTLTPFVAIGSNSHKVEGILEDVGLAEGGILTADEIDLDFMEFMSNKGFTSQEIQLICSYNSEAKIKIKEMFSAIASIASESE